MDGCVIISVMCCLGVRWTKEEFAWIWVSETGDTDCWKGGWRTEVEMPGIPTHVLLLICSEICLSCHLLVSSSIAIPESSHLVTKLRNTSQEDNHFPQGTKSGDHYRNAFFAILLWRLVLWFPHELQFVYPHRHLRWTTECLFLWASIFFQTFSSAPIFMCVWELITSASPLFLVYSQEAFFS